MIKRTIEISSDAAHVTVQHRQLTLQRNGTTIGTTPCEDVGVVLVDHPGTTYTHAALASLVDSEAVVVICGRDHLPAGVLLPLANNSQIVSRVNSQINASKPLQKRLWQQIVQAKILGQAANLDPESPKRHKLTALAKTVRSGDPTNIEAQAARHYWSDFIDDRSFRRNANAAGLNALLNYGYAVMRAATARSLVAAGLVTAIGLHHINNRNSFCLADDMMEPLRPLVDDRARTLFQDGCTTLNQEAKAGLLSLLGEVVVLGEDRGPLMVNLHRMTASLVRCFQGSQKRLEIPHAC